MVTKMCQRKDVNMQLCGQLEWSNFMTRLKVNNKIKEEQMKDLHGLAN